MLKCQCNCGQVSCSIPYIPDTIANCYCSICRRVYKKEYTSFAKYNTQQIILKGREHVKFLRCTEIAVRGYCSLCKTYLFMYYDESENIWMNTERFNFDIQNIPSYNIYKT